MVTEAPHPGPSAGAARRPDGRHPAALLHRGPGPHHRRVRDGGAAPAEPEPGHLETGPGQHLHPDTPALQVQGLPPGQQAQ